MRIRSRVVGAVAGVAALVVGLAGAVPAAAQTATPTGTVVVVHGLVDFPADVYLDGSSTPALSGFEFRRVTDPLALPAGVHRADLRRAGDPATAPPALSGSFTVVADQRVTVAALPDSGGKPSWLAFPNDAQVVEPAKGELRFRHFAATTPVVVTVDGQPALSGVSNLAASGQAAPVRVDPGVHRVAVLDAAGQPLVAAQDVNIGAGSLVNLYLTGLPASGLALMQEPMGPPDLKVLQQTPSQVPGGNSGLAAAHVARPRDAALPLAATAAAAALLICAGVALRPRRLRPVLVPVARARR